MNIFNYEGFANSTLGKVADIVILNFLLIIFSIPIVTIGASVTAAHYAVLKSRRGEGYIWKNFLKSFKENLLQSTILFFLFAIAIALFVLIPLYTAGKISGLAAVVFSVVDIVFLIFVLFTMTWVFPVQARFTGNIGITIRNALFLSFKYILRTLGMLVVSTLPLAFIFYVHAVWFIILLLLGFSLPVYLSVMMYDKVFEQLENQILENSRME